MKLRFESLQLENFAIYPFVEIDFSLDEKLPLTLIRGENNSGKTTLMRAFIWMLFGEQFVPALANSIHPIRPAWAEGDLLTRGELLFRAEESKDEYTKYMLVRKGRTSISSGSVRYDNDELDLFMEQPGSGFVKANNRLVTLQTNYFPEGMREFIIIDADKADDFVGGNATDPNVHLMRETTTTAVHALLGLEPIRRVSKRVRDLASKAMSEAAKSSGDRDLQALGDQEDAARAKVEGYEAEIAALEVDLEMQKEAASKAKSSVDSNIGQIDELKRLQGEVAALGRLRESYLGARKQGIAQLSELMKSEQCMVGLLAPVLATLVETLDPLKEIGRIPATEIALLPRLLQDDQCVCGLKFSEHPDRLAEVQRRIEISVPQRAEANFGDQTLEEARSLINRAIGPGAENWEEAMRDERSQLGEVDQELKGLDQKIERLEKELEEKGGESSEFLQEVINNHNVLRDRVNAQERKLDQAKSLLAAARTEHRSTSEKLKAARTKSGNLAKAQRTAKVAELLADVIVEAQSTIESSQIKEIDTTVDEIFKDVVGVGVDSHFSHVGIRSVAGGGDQYEPFVLGADGNDRPMSLVNGASRRAISVAIVIALSKVTGTSIPFIADSLFHATSGSVKLRLVDYLTSGREVGQPILFATRDDLLGAATDVDGKRVLDIVNSRAGSTYTVTSQAEAGRNVLRRDPNAVHPQQSVVCRCGANEFCETCEREGDAGANYLVKRGGKQK